MGTSPKATFSKPPPAVPYEHRLRTDPRSRCRVVYFFEGTSKLQVTLRALQKRLDELKIDYAVIGGMALTAYGYARMTEDIDILITKPDLNRLHAALSGRGYKREFTGSKNIRDTDTGVRIEFV